MPPNERPAVAPPACVRTETVETAAGRAHRWGIAEECAVEIGFNGRAWTVMMASPADLEDLAVGLAVTEGAVAAAGRIRAVDITTWPEGITIDLRLDETDLKAGALRRRSLDGMTGCGLCGVESLADAVRPAARPVRSRPRIASDAIAAGFARLSDHQPLNARTCSAHVAAWCDTVGRLILAREDVGRHNALDKVIGALHRADRAGEPGFVIMSSRCGVELVGKAARLNAGMLATVSAPTGHALDLARAVGLPLACRGPGGAVTHFARNRDKAVSRSAMRCPDGR